MSESGGTLSFLPRPDSGPDPDDFLNLVLDGWGSSMRARGLKPEYVRSSRSAVMELCDSSGRYPWEWSIQDATDWLDHLRGVRGLAHTTVRSYQGKVEAFCTYATSSAYDWSEQAALMFGHVFSQVITEFNRATHSQEHEARPEKRAFTRRELQQLFDLMDLEHERALAAGRNGALSALRDAAAFKFAYGWGLRAYETSRLQIVDFSPNARAPYFGDYGNLYVRFGKAKAGDVFKPRNVLTVFDWAAEVADDWIHFGLPRYGMPLTDLFPTNTGRVVSTSQLWRRMSDAINELGFGKGLDFHSLRRSYATHLLTEYAYDLKFVQMQLGHEHAATTSIYTLPSADYQVRELERVHDATLSASGARPPRPSKRLKLPPLPPLRRTRKHERGTS